MKEPFRLLVGVPTTDYMPADFVKSLIGLTGHMSHEGIHYQVEVKAGTLVYFARNSLANMAVEKGFTHLLFLDSDMVFDEMIVETLLFSGKGFVCGAFQSRRPPYGSCVFTRLKPLERVKDYGMEPFRVAGCGMACTMIRTDILKTVLQTYGTCFDPAMIDGVSFGEDLAFCWRAAKTGAEIWCDPTARVGHIAHRPVWPGEGSE